MAASISYPLINGVRATFADIVISVKPAAVGEATPIFAQNPTVGTSVPFVGVKSIDWKDGLKPAKVYGTAVGPVARTRGKYDASGSIELYQEEFAILRGLLAPSGAGYQEVPFDINITWLVQSTAALNTTTLLSCRITDASRNGSAGSEEAMSVKCELDIMQVLENGQQATYDALFLLGSALTNH